MDTTTHTTHHRALPPELIASLQPPGPLGERGEALAAHHLVADDRLDIVERNWRLATGELRGELDLLAQDPRDGSLVVCEVKTRRDAQRFGGAVATVDARKQARIRSLTAAFLRASEQRYPRIRLDLIAIDLGHRPQLSHLVGVL